MRDVLKILLTNYFSKQQPCHKNIRLAELIYFTYIKINNVTAKCENIPNFKQHFNLSQVQKTHISFQKCRKAL